MAKWYGTIGYSETEETAPGVWKDNITERKYIGDVIGNTSGWANNPDSTNDDLTVNSRISIVADPFAYQKFNSMKWIEFMGCKWKVRNVDPKPPRLIISLGGEWNE